MYAWASADQGMLLCAPTGTGKTLVAEAALFEALRSGTHLYYSTPLIALTDQKLQEFQQTVSRWGYPADTVGLITGNRAVNPQAPIKVVVAEVLLNRLLQADSYDFAQVGAVVMDEFHNFNDPQRGLVWELALTLMPAHIRVMLLSATVGAAPEFISWMNRSLNRQLTLVQSDQRKVPLHFHWIGDELLPDFIEQMAQAAGETRKTPALIFCFDRQICWDTADVLKGRDLFAEGQRKALLDRLEDFDFKIGAGGKLRTFLTRGIGLHHAGLLPRYRRIVETLFQEKLLSVCVCTETLAAGINLPARSVVLTTLVKGPRDRKRLIDPSSAQQMFGRAGRPQFDDQGHVFALAHEDDVKLARWKKRYDSIPEESKDPKLMAAKKALLKKKPTRRAGFTYWNPEQFTKLQIRPPARLASRGRLSWRWLAYLLEAGPSVAPIRQVIERRLMDGPGVQAELKRLTKMLVTLHQLELVKLDPAPPPAWINAARPVAIPTNLSPLQASDSVATDSDDEGTPDDEPASNRNIKIEPDVQAGHDDNNQPVDLSQLLGQLKLGEEIAQISQSGRNKTSPVEPVLQNYEPLTATPTARLHDLTVFRAVHPLYGLFLMNYLSQAQDHELLQILESLLEIPGTVARSLRVPWPDVLIPGPLTLEQVDPLLLQRGLLTHEQLYPPQDQSDLPPELRLYPIPLAEKMRLIFESEIDHAGGLSVTPVWAAGDLLAHGGDFDKYIRSRDLVKQEGIIFKHLLRLVLLCGEFTQLTPPNTPSDVWQARLNTIATTLTATCRAVDEQSTDQALEQAEGNL